MLCPSLRSRMKGLARTARNKVEYVVSSDVQLRAMHLLQRSRGLDRWLSVTTGHIPLRVVHLVQGSRDGRLSVPARDVRRGLLRGRMNVYTWTVSDGFATLGLSSGRLSSRGKCSGLGCPQADSAGEAVAVRRLIDCASSIVPDLECGPNTEQVVSCQNRHIWRRRQGTYVFRL